MQEVSAAGAAGILADGTAAKLSPRAAPITYAGTVERTSERGLDTTDTCDPKRRRPSDSKRTRTERERLISKRPMIRVDGCRARVSASIERVARRADREAIVAEPRHDAGVGVVGGGGGDGGVRPRAGPGHLPGAFRRAEGQNHTHRGVPGDGCALHLGARRRRPRGVPATML